jgi:cardiolipin synthase A/B
MRLTHLRPFAGRRLPLELQPRSVIAEAAAFPGGVHDPRFAALVSRIDTGPFHPGNRVQVFFEGKKAFQAAGAAIDQAREEVLLECYIIRDDATGRATLETLARAAARGVKVRVLADAWGSWTTRTAFWDDMKRAGIAVRLFHPLWKKWASRSNRDHRKILVVDRQVSFTGGMNVANEYGSSWRSNDDAFRDTLVRMEGLVAHELALVFQEGWTRAGGRGLAVELPPPKKPEPPGARILVVDTRAGRGQREKISVLATVLGAARQRVWITTAYFAPGSASVAFLGHAAARGVDVRLLLPGRSDVPLIRHAGHGYYTDLLERGVRVFEYQPHTLHAKTLVADDYVSLVGSSNLDARSLRFNAECNVLVLDEETGRTLSAGFERDLANAVELRLPDWHRRSVFHRWADAGARLLSPVL